VEMKISSPARLSIHLFIRSIAFAFLLAAGCHAQSDSVAGFSDKSEILFSGKANRIETWKDIKTELKKYKSSNEATTIALKASHWKFYNAKGETIIDSISQFIAVKELGIKIQANYNWGLIGNDAKLIAKPQYSEIKMQDGVVLVKNQNLISIKNEQEQTVKELRLGYFKFLSRRFAVYASNKKFGIINAENYQFISKPIYDEISLFNDTIFLVKSGDKYGLVDYTDQILIPVEYSSIEKDTLNFIRLKRERGAIGNSKTTVGICNYQGRILVPLIYTGIGNYTSGLFPAKNEKYWGYLNAEGEQAIPFFYDTYRKFVSGVAAVRKNGLVGIIDTKGNWVAYPEYETVQYVNDSVWIWRRGYVSGFYSTTEKKGIPFMYDGLELINSNFVRFSQSGKYGLLSPQRKIILKAEWDKIEVYEDEKIVIAMRNDYYSIFYLNGNLKVYMNYPFARFHSYKDGMALVAHKGKYGFINRDGLLLVSTQYDEARPFSNGLAAIRIGTIWGYIDKNERFIANPYYDESKDFDEKAAIVIKSGKYGLINKQGKETVKPQCEAIVLLKSGNYLLKKEGRYGIANAKGEESINPIYKDILELKPGIFRVRLYGKYALVDMNHKILTKTEYDNIEYSEATRAYIYTTKFEWKPLNQ